MKTLISLLLLVHGAVAVTHSMTYVVTTVFGMEEFPEHNEVGLVNGQEFVHYDSHLKRIIPKTDWIEKNMDADYWERETQRNINTEQVFKANVRTAMGRFNQTDGKHIFQRMYGCDWDDATGEVTGYEQYGYDGEDFISMDVKEGAMIASKQQAVITKQKWDGSGYVTSQKNYLTELCPDWLKKYINYGKISLLRTDLPSVSLLQKSPSSPISCFATGFYPNRADMFWRRDGEEIHTDVDKGEILPNPDGTFQMRVHLDLSSLRDQDKKKYECVFQLSGVKDVVTKLDRAEIKTNEGRSLIEGNSMSLIIVIVAVVLVVLVAVIGFIVYRKRNAKRPPSPVSNPEVMEQLNPSA